MNPLIEVALIALALFALNNFVRHKFTNKEAMEKLKEKQKEWKALLKSRDKHSAKRIEEVQKEVMELNFKVMRGTMPSMLITIVIFIFVLLPVMNANYSSIDFPPRPYITFLPGESWIWYYFLIIIVFSILLAIAKRLWKKHKAKSE